METPSPEIMNENIQQSPLARLILVRNVILLGSLVVMLLLLALYLWGPRFFSAPSKGEDATVEIPFLTDVRRLGGIITEVRPDGFVLEMQSSAFPQSFDPALLVRTVKVGEGTELLQRNRVMSVGEYAEKSRQYDSQETFYKNLIASTTLMDEVIEQLQASTTYGTTTIDLTDAVLLLGTSTRQALGYIETPPSLDALGPVDAAVLVPGTYVSVLANESIYTSPEIVATQVVIHPPQ